MVMLRVKRVQLNPKPAKIGLIEINYGSVIWAPKRGSALNSRSALKRGFIAQALIMRKIPQSM